MPTIETEPLADLQQPVDHNLRITLPGGHDLDLPGDLADDLASYLESALEHEAHVAEANEAFRAFLSTGGKTQLGTIETRGRQLAEQRQQIERERVDLLWQRHALIERLVGPLAEARRAAEGDYEAACEAARQRLAAEGITERGLSSYRHNPNAARVQFLHDYLKRQPEVMGAQERLDSVATSAAAAESGSAVPPRTASARIDWHPPESERQHALLMLSGIPAKWSLPPGPPLSTTAESVRREVGLGDSPLLEHHAATLERLAELGSSAVARPLHNASPRRIDEVLALLEALPRTAEAIELRTFLRETQRLSR